MANHQDFHFFAQLNITFTIWALQVYADVWAQYFSLTPFIVSNFQWLLDKMDFA